MGIREITKDGVTIFEISISVRSKLNKKFRSQRKREAQTLKEAEKLEKALTLECSMEVAKLEGSGVLWADLLEMYELAHRSNSPLVKKIQLSTVWDCIGTLRRFTSSWDKRFCKDILPRDAREILQEMLNQGYSRSRVKAVKSGINTVFAWGIDSGSIVGIRTSPVLDIKLQKAQDEKPPQVLSLTEIQKLLETAKRMDHDWYCIWFMALHTGMRSGELYALEWSDIEFETRMISCSKSYNGRLKKIKSTKAGYWRKIPMSPEVESLLRSLYSKKLPTESHVLPRIEMWKRGEAAKVLREFCEAIGITSINFHALRACFATHLLNSGVSSPVVKKICGWTDEKVMTRYIRLAGIDVRGSTDGLRFQIPEVSDTNGESTVIDFHMATKYVPNRS